ncbi:MAG TPA: CHRD domain-containing protein, partial [Ferruginibacter sp.]|nr:CHRD domain-containing protein [Ferruginibacter sp.]
MEKKYNLSTFFIILFILLTGFTVKAAIYPFTLTYFGNQQNPPVNTTGTGVINGTYNDVTNTIYYNITFNGLLANVTAAHFHAPAPAGSNAGVIINYDGFPLGGTSGTYTNSNILTDAQEVQLKAGLLYSNIHTTLNPGGEIRAQMILGPASTTIYSINQTLVGAQQVPPVNSPGTGTFTGTYNPATNTIFYRIVFSGLSSNVTAAHFHAPAVLGTNAGVIINYNGFPLGGTSGTYSNVNVLTDLQETQLLGGLFYSNIHTTINPGGEIRAQLFPVLAPSIGCITIQVIESADPGVCTLTKNLTSFVTGVPAPTVVYRIGTTVITSPYAFPVGTTTVTATATNSEGSSSCSYTVIVDDLQDPVIGNMTPSLSTLWPVNHKMKDITVNYTSTDNCPGVVNCALSVSSNQGGSRGSGNTSPDWEVIDAHHLRLRAERSGNAGDRI